MALAGVSSSTRMSKHRFREDRGGMFPYNADTCLPNYIPDGRNIHMQTKSHIYYKIL